MIQFIFFVSLLSGACGAAPATINLGGIFTQLNSNGNADPVALQSQAAFLLAVKHINNKADGIYDDLLPDTQIKVVVRHANTQLDTITTMNSMTEATVGGVKVKAVINGLSDAVSHFEVPIAELADIFMVRASTLEPFESVAYPRISIKPDFPFEIGMTQKLFCVFGISEVSIITDGIGDDVEAVARLTDGGFCNIKVISTTLVGNSILFDMDTAMATLRNTRVNTFVIVTADPAVTGRVLESGYNMGLFREGTQVMLPGQAVSPDTWQKGMSAGADVASIMKGNFAMQYRANNNALLTASGPQYFLAWKSQPSTAANAGVCNAAVDDSDQAQLLHASPDGVCTGLTFSSFANLLQLSDGAYTTYDAVLAFAAGMHRELYDLDNGLPSSAMAYMQAITEAAKVKTITGITGRLSFDSRGVRNDGVLYAFVNFKASLFNAGASNVFSAAAVLSSALVLRVCGLLPINIRLPDCAQPIFNSADNAIIRVNGKYKTKSAPDVIKIAAYVNLFDGNGDVDPEMVQYLSAILMAVDEVNHKSDGIFDTLLPNSKVVLVLQQPEGFNGIEDAVFASSFESFGSTGILGSISMLGDTDTLQLNRKYGTLELPVVSAIAPSPSLGDPTQIRYTAQTNNIKSFEGSVWQHMICNLFRYDTFSIFATDDFFGQKASVELADGTYCGVKPIRTHYVNKDGVGLEDELALAKKMGARIFVFAFSEGYSEEVVMLLEKGYEMGVFEENTQIFGTSDTFDGVVSQLSANAADVKMLMKGVMYIKYNPLKMMTNNNVGLSFFERWRNQAATQWTDSNGKQICNQMRDDDDYQYLYRNMGYSDVANFTCAGLNYSSFASDASDVAPYLGHAYDATLVLLHGLNATLHKVGAGYTGDELMDAIFFDTLFDGATGEVDIFEGMADFGGYARGSREVSHVYDVMNFNSALYDTNGPTGEVFKHVFVWTAEEGASQVDSIEFNSKDNKIVADHLPDVVDEQYFDEKFGLLFAISICCVLVSTFFILMILLNKKSKVISSSQPRMSVIILIGGLFVSIRVLNASFRITDTQCIVGLWFGHLAFVLVFCALFIKMWRLAALINAGLKKVKISEWFVVSITGGLFAAMVAYLCVLTWVGEPHADLRCETESNRNSCDRICSFEYPQLHTALFCLEGIAVFYGAYLCYKIKGAPAAVNDSKENGQAILMLAVFAGATFPLVFLINLTPGLVQLIASCSIGICYIIMATLLFVPKLKKMLVESMEKKKVGSESSGNRSSVASESHVEDTTETAASSNSSMNLSSLLMKKFTKNGFSAGNGVNGGSMDTPTKKEPPVLKFSSLNPPTLICHPVNEETREDIKKVAYKIVEEDNSVTPIDDNGFSSKNRDEKV